MLRPAGFSDDGSSDEDNFDEYPQKGGSIFGNQVNVTEEEKATISNIVEDNGWDETKKATDLAIAKANLVEAIEAGNLESVRSLLEAVEVNTPLHAWGWGQVTASGLACGHGQHRVLELLVSEGLPHELRLPAHELLAGRSPMSALGMRHLAEEAPSIHRRAYPP